MKEHLEDFNEMVRIWADKQPEKYRLAALAFGYRCDTETHSFSGTLQWISDKSRKRKGEGVSRPTLVRHLRVFKRHGVITVERRRQRDKNLPSVYHVDFDAVIDESSAEPTRVSSNIMINDVALDDDDWDDDDDLSTVATPTGRPARKPRNTAMTDDSGFCRCIGCDRGEECLYDEIKDWDSPDPWA